MGINKIYLKTIIKNCVVLKTVFKHYNRIIIEL